MPLDYDLLLSAQSAYYDIDICADVVKLTHIIQRLDWLISRAHATRPSSNITRPLHALLYMLFDVCIFVFGRLSNAVIPSYCIYERDKSMDLTMSEIYQVSNFDSHDNNLISGDRVIVQLIYSWQEPAAHSTRFFFSFLLLVDIYIADCCACSAVTWLRLGSTGW